MRNSILEEAIEAWEDARNGVIAEVENIPADRFDFRPTDSVRDVRDLVLHIMEVGLMMAGELTRQDGSFRRAPYPKLIAEYRGPIRDASNKRQLLAALRRTLKDGIAQFREAGEMRMLQFILRFDGQPGSRLAWFHHGIAHEEYHRGQLALFQRLMGITPALTKLITGES